MKYLVLIYADEKIAANMPQDQMQTYMAEYNTYTDDLKKAGIYVGGEALQPTSTATTVRVRNAKKSTTHGPFAETKEQLGGFYYLDCKNLDEATDWAAKCPDARYGSIEVRPIMDFSQGQ